MKNIFFITLLSFNFCIAQDYYFYVAAESDDTVSLIKFDGEKATEVERIPVGIMKTEIEGPHGLTVDPSGTYWYLSLAHGNPYGSLVKYSIIEEFLVSKEPVFTYVFFKIILSGIKKSMSLSVSF